MKGNIKRVNRNSSGKFFWGSLIGIILSIGIIAGLIFGVPTVQSEIAESFVEKSPTYQSTKLANDDLKIELDNSNIDLLSTRAEVSLANEEIDQLEDNISSLEELISEYEDRISYLEYQVDFYKSESNEIRRVLNAQFDGEDLYLDLYAIRHDLRLTNNQMIYDHQNQTDQTYITRDDLINALPLNVRSVEKCYWYHIGSRSLNRYDTLLKTVNYIAYSDCTQEVVFIDVTSGEVIPSISDYIDYYADSETFEICADFVDSIEMEFYTAEENQALGHQYSDTTIPIKKLKLTLKIHPWFNLQKGLYVSSEGDEIRINNSNSAYGTAYYHNMYCNYSDNHSTITFFNFQGVAQQTHIADIISNTSFILYDKVYTLTVAQEYKNCNISHAPQFASNRRESNSVLSLELQLLFPQIIKINLT